MNIPKLIAKLNNIHEHFCFDGSSKNAKDIANALLAQQVVIEQMREALGVAEEFIDRHSESWYLSGQQDLTKVREAIALQPSLSALREHDAEVCQEFANFLGIEKREDVVKWIEHIRKGE